MSAVHLPPADIRLDPGEWYVANWRHLPPLPRVTAPPFDLAACSARLAPVRVNADGVWDWSSARIGPNLSPVEGRFWLEAFRRASTTRPAPAPADLADTLLSLGPQPPLSRRACAAYLKACHAHPPEIVTALASQLEPPTLIEVLLSHRQGHLTWLNDGFRRFVRPWLTPQELEAARQVVRDQARPRRRGEEPLLPYFVVSLMASLGMTVEVEAALSGWLPSTGPDAGLRERHFAVFGLADPARVIPTLRRLNLSLYLPEQVRGLLAHLEAKAIPFVRDAILDCGNRPWAEALTPPLGLVHRPETARVLLLLTQRSRAPAPAQKWLDENRELAVAGLLPLIDDSELGAAALNYLRNQVRAGQETLIEQHLDGLAPDLAARARRALETTAAMQAVDDEGVPAWFPPGERRKPRFPGWLDPATLPPLRIQGQRLPVAQVTTLLALLRDRELDNTHPVFAQLKEHAEPRLLDAFAWALFDRWHSGSADAKDKWTLTGLGHLGGDGVCLQLAALVAVWPGKSQHLRASLGLRCLEAIGTPLAQLCIHRLAQTSSYAVGAEADVVIRGLCRRHRLSLAQLEDRIVPTLGLDADGARRLQYPGGVYRLTLGPDRQARLLDERRQYRSELPELAEGDDPARVEAARAEWDLFVLQTREVMQIQTERLRQAMLRWRRWQAADFERFIVRHPLLGFLARAVLWGAFETISKLRFAFRVTEGRNCVDAAGSPVVLEPDWPIGVVHPVLLPPDERMVWTDVLSEQGVALPAWQMARAVHTIEPGERGQRQLSRWTGRPLDFEAMCAASRPLGYASGARQRGHICCRVQYYPALDLTAYLVHTPIPEDATWEARQQPVELLGCQFREGDTTTRVPNVEIALPLGEVDPVLLDEVIGGMNELTQTARKVG